MRQFGLYEAPTPSGTLHPLRPRQSAAIEAIRQAIKEGHKRIILQLPTGAGKTVISAHLVSQSAAKGKRPLFACPAIALVNQTLKSFEKQGIDDIGVIQGQHERTDFRAQIQIASRDTLVRRTLPQIDFVLVDEVHDRRDSFDAILNSDEWKNKIVIGLSATPWAKGLGLLWTKLIVGATIQELIDEGWLCPFKVFAPADEYEVNTDGIKVVAGEFDDDSAARAVNQPKIVGNVVENWLKRRQAGEHCGDRTFLYGQNRAHAKALMEAFQAHGVNCGYIDGLSTESERKVTFERYRRRDDEVLANVGVLATGIDEDVRVMVDAALRKSESNWVQVFGRGLRLADGKDYLRFYDHAGNSMRLGLPTDIHHDTLDMRKTGDKGDAYENDKPAPKPVKCKKCYAIIPPKSPVCAQCGEKRPSWESQNKITHAPGELAEFKGKKKKEKKPEPTMADKQAFYSGVLALAQERGRSKGWAAHFYRERYGVWPNKLIEIPKTPSAEVRSYDRHRRIAWAKSQEKAGTTAQAGQ